MITHHSGLGPLAQYLMDLTYIGSSSVLLVMKSESVNLPRIKVHRSTIFDLANESSANEGISQGV